MLIVKDEIKDYEVTLKELMEYAEIHDGLVEETVYSVDSRIAWKLHTLARQLFDEYPLDSRFYIRPLLDMYYAAMGDYEYSAVEMLDAITAGIMTEQDDNEAEPMTPQLIKEMFDDRPVEEYGDIIYALDGLESTKHVIILCKRYVMLTILEYVDSSKVVSIEDVYRNFVIDLLDLADSNG